jgi:hypothetical protein
MSKDLVALWPNHYVCLQAAITTLAGGFSIRVFNVAGDEDH